MNEWDDIDNVLNRTIDRLDRQKARQAVTKSNAKKLVPDKDRLLSLDREIEELSWTPVESIALFSLQTCLCGISSYSFIQFMERQIRNNTRRLVKVSTPSPRLPKTTMLKASTSLICPSCVEGSGFSLASAIPFPIQDTPYAAS